MNYQALLKQAQAMQKKIMDSKSKIDSTIYEGNSEMVTIKMNGKREVVSINIKEDAELDDKEMLEDMMTISINDVLKKIEKEIESKLGNQTGGFNGLF